MVSVCLSSEALSQHLPSYLGFSYLRRGVSLHGCSGKVKPLLLTLDKGYLLTANPPDLEHGVAPLSPLDGLWIEVHDIVHEAGTRPYILKRNAKKENGCLKRPYK